MKKTTLLLLMLIVASFSYSQERECAAMTNLAFRQQQDPSLEQRMLEIEIQTQQQIEELKNNREINGSIITIPVVVHILYTNSTNNISDAQILSQMDVLNEDFRRLNANQDTNWSQAADVEIEFCLASIDPNGNATNAITRTSTPTTTWNTDLDYMKMSSQGGVDPWDPSQYLNMWVVPELRDSQNRLILGYAQFPGGPAATDGVVMGYKYFGRIGTVSPPFDQGRTTTHEVGHYLNLRHIWGDGGCSYDDFVSDTPTSDAPNYGCPTSHVSCSSLDMVQNYMDYSDDPCMNLFTQGQKDRMRVLLLPGGVREALGASTKCGPPAEPTCDDGIQNGDETGVDCGGTSCPACPEPTCDDGIQNGDETGVDCGGSNCAPCQIACSSTVTSFPYDEGFENTLGAWTHDSTNDFNWSVDSGGTPSSNTGPSSADQGSYYVYMEASSPNYPSKRAILNSPCFDLSSATEPSISFSYHMYGSNIGSLNLEATTDGINWISIWSEAGNQGDIWLQASVDLSSYIGGTLQLRFNGLTGSSYRGDIALDALNVITEIPEPTCDDGIQNGDETGVDCGGSFCAPCPSGCVGGETLPYTEGFESSIGLWTQSSGDDLDWTRDSNGTPSSNTGPSSGFDGSWYVYVEASGNGTGYPNKQAILNSPCIDLSGMSTASFSFNYHMYGSSNMGTIDLEISVDDGNNWISIWNESGNKGNSWQSANIDLTPYAGNGVLLRFNRVTGSTWQADLALDAISVSGTSGTRIGSEAIKTERLILSPNPVNGSLLNVEIINGTAREYIIYNISGQVVMQGTLDTSIDVNVLSEGMYIIKVNTLNEYLIGKFIKK